MQRCSANDGLKRCRVRVLCCLTTAVLLFAMVLSDSIPGLAKAHLIIVFPLRSTPELSSVATQMTTDIAGRLAAIPGFDAQVLQTPATGGLGVAAASAGADLYIVGAISDDARGYALNLSSFDASNDVMRSTLKSTVPSSGPLLSDLDFSTLIQSAAPAVAAPPSNLISGLAIGTPIGILLDTPLSSRGATGGQTFTFHAADNIYAVDGTHVSIVKGAPGAGEVQTVQGAAGNGSGGKISLQFDWIIATDGSKVPLTNSQSSTEGGDSKGASSTATIATYLLLGPLGFFAHNFVRGKDAEISTKTPLTAYVDRTLRPGPISTLPPASVDSPTAPRSNDH
jgi:hypothetical protein